MTEGERAVMMLTWLSHAGALPNGVEIRYEDDGRDGPEYRVTWGAKLGHFAYGDTIGEAIDNAMTRDAWAAAPLRGRPELEHPLILAAREALAHAHGELGLPETVVLPPTKAVALTDRELVDELARRVRS